MNQDEKIEQGLKQCMRGATACTKCPYFGEKCTNLPADALNYINRLKEERQGPSKTQLKELLSALYKLTDNVWQAYELCRDDVLKLAKDYGIKEEELK